MVLKFYGNKISTCTARVYAALLEKKAEFEFVQVEWSEIKTPEYLKKQPFGQVPYIDDDGFILHESRAITEYIDAKFKNQGTPLLPQNDAKALALARQWIYVELENFNPSASCLAYELLFKGFFNPANPTADVKLVEQYKEKLGKVFDVYEARLAKHHYLAGDAFTLADLHHLPYAEKLFASGNGHFITSRPNVNAWWERISKRESWQAALKFPTA